MALIRSEGGSEVKVESHHDESDADAHSSDDVQFGVEHLTDGTGTALGGQGMDHRSIHPTSEALKHGSRQSGGALVPEEQDRLCSNQGSSLGIDIYVPIRQRCC